MNTSLYAFMRFPKPVIPIILAAMAFTACTPDGVINKTKYNGQKITNTCDQFKEEIQQIINANSNASTLVVSEYEHASFELEPGQFEITKDNVLRFKFAQDLEFPKYITKKNGIAIHVTAVSNSLDHLKNIENPNSVDLGMLVIDYAYLESHPDFVYEMPISDGMNGKQVSLKFTVVQYKKGKVKKVFCDSENVPLGPVTPSCCSFNPWEPTQLMSVVEMPTVDIKDETYRYKGFTGTLDIIFPENSAKFDPKITSDAINNYIKKYEGLGFNVTKVKLEGWASLGGVETKNQELSEKRSAAVYEDLVKQMNNPNVQVEHRGMGEDWERLKLLVKTNVMSPDEQKMVLDIADGAGTNDEKEALMRKLPFWDKLVKEVIVNTRHTYVTFSFDYSPDKMYVEYYPSTMPLVADELYNVATKTFSISKWTSGETKKGLKTLDILIGNNKKANLFAMRSTYHFGNKDFISAMKDIDEALKLDNSNSQYTMASLAYKTKFAENYSMEDRMKMLDQYNDLASKNPNNTGLLFNRTVLMDKVGYITGALSEYKDLLEGNTASASNLNNMGVAKLKTNRIYEAEADFLAAIDKDPSIAEPYFNLAVIYGYKGMTSKVIEYLDLAIARDENIKSMIWTNPAFSQLKETPKFDKYR